MATQEQLKNARELLDLDVKEVSLVDKPANLRPFLIVKRQAENNLGEYELAGTPGAPTESILQGGTPMETVEMIKARHVYEVAVQKAGQTEETEDQLKQRHETELQEVQKGDGEAPAEPEPKPEAETPPAEPEEKPAEEPAAEPVAKAEPATEPDPDEEPAVVIKRDGSIHVAGQTVQKAKTFGKGKTVALQNAVSALAKLLGDVSEDALKAAMSPFMDPSKKVETTKAATEPAAEPTPTADPAELITKAVASALEPITKRLDEIEKTRNPSQSVEGDGGTDSNTKVQKGMWTGII